jgi:alpha-beta hydrolase superfamily lysophospholipase
MKMPEATTHEITVTVPGTDWTCSASLTVPEDCHGPLQILVHGATYNRWYWDPDVQRERFSYVYAAAERGLATLNLDLPGYGRSDHPDGTALGLSLHAAVIDQAAALARTGLAGHRWDRVVGVGHSLGSCIVTVALGEFDSLDAAVLTGLSHDLRPVDDAAGLMPAATDPVFRDRATEGYLTVPAGARPYYYHLPTTEPGILFEDERHRDVLAVADADDYVRRMRARCDATVPLLIVLGACDWAFVARDDEEFRTAESAWYPRAPTVDFRIYPDTGHNLNLHGAADKAIADMLDWIAALPSVLSQK